MVGKMRHNATKCNLVPARSARETYNHEFYKYTDVVWPNNQCFISDILVFAVDAGAFDCKRKNVIVAVSAWK